MKTKTMYYIYYTIFNLAIIILWFRGGVDIMDIVVLIGLLGLCINYWLYKIYKK